MRAPAKRPAFSPVPVVVGGRVVELDESGRFMLRLDGVPDSARVDAPGWVTLHGSGAVQLGDPFAYVAAVESAEWVGPGRWDVFGGLVLDDVAGRPGVRAATGKYARVTRLQRRFLGLFKGRRLTRWELVGGELWPVHESLMGVDSLATWL